MKKTDINKYNTVTGPMATEGSRSRSVASAARFFGRSLFKAFFTCLIVLCIAGTVVGVTVVAFIFE